jgi:hypothetical protein
VVDPAQPKDLEFRLREPATVDLHLTGLPPEAPASSWRIYVKDVLEANGMSFSGSGYTVTGEGRCLLETIQPGPHTLVLVHESLRLSGWIHAQAYEVDVASGPSELVLSVPPLHEIVLAGPGLPEGSVQLDRLDWTRPFVSQIVLEREADRVVLRFVPPGRYRITGKRGGSRFEREIIVTRSETIRLP